ncbi:MAG: outer membrane protein W [Thermoproteota archaeon]|jgi:outer membrane protein W
MLFKKKEILKGMFFTLPLLSASLMFTNPVMADDEQILNSEPINVVGYVREDAPVTDSELQALENEIVKQKTTIKLNRKKTKNYKKLQRSTEKLADETESYMSEKRDAEKTVTSYNKRIKCLLEKSNPKECDEGYTDKVKTQAAAVAKTEVAAPAAAASTLGEMGDLKILPFAGLTSVSLDSGTLESTVAVGLKAEMNLGKRFSVGVGFKYTTLENTDYCTEPTQCSNLSWYSPGQNIGRDTKLTQYAFSAHGKFYMTSSSRFRPYVGAGLSYERANFKYTSEGNNFNNFNNFYNQSNGNDDMDSSSFSAQVLLGSEFKLSERFGLNIEVEYSKNMSSNTTQNNPYSIYQNGQQRLQDLSNNLQEADYISIFAGMVVTF